MQDAPPAVQQLFADLVRRLHQSDNKRESERAKADPHAYKKSLVFEQGLSYRYVDAGRDGRKRRIRFCWSCHRNVAGFFLGWREVVGKKGGKRDQWVSRRIRTRVRAIAERRAAAFRKKYECLISPSSQAATTMANISESGPTLSSP